MISIIVCSTSAIQSDTLNENIQATIGTPYELISIDNSKGEYSICNAYNRGIAQAKFPYLVFVHQDIVFQTTNWGQHLVKHLQSEETGIIGLAGSQMAHRIPQEAWKGYHRAAHFLQGNPYGTKAPRLYYLPKNYSQPLYPAVCLDGMFLAMRKSLTNILHFDENIKGFHTYDIDICLQSAAAGYRNYVTYDILIAHLSAGKLSKDYYQQLLETYRKWQDRLPITIPALRGETTIIQQEEHKQLRKLSKQLLRKGFQIPHVLQIINEYSTLIDHPLTPIGQMYWKIRLHMQRIYSRLRHKM